jgi:hypothetical protein
VFVVEWKTKEKLESVLLYDSAGTLALIKSYTEVWNRSTVLPIQLTLSNFK